MYVITFFLFQFYKVQKFSTVHKNKNQISTQNMADLPSPSTTTVTTSEPKDVVVEEKKKPKRKPVKEKKPLSEKRIAQLAAARAAHVKKAAERRRQKASSSSSMDEDSYEDSGEEKKKHTSRLVKGNGEAAQRYLDTLKSVNPDVEIAKSEPKNKKRKAEKQGDRNSGDEIDLKGAALAGAGLLGAAALAYVAGKNYTPAAIKSGFTAHGSAIPGDPSTGQPAIPVQDLLKNIPRNNDTVTFQGSHGQPSAPSLGFFV